VEQLPREYDSSVHRAKERTVPTHSSPVLVIDDDPDIRDTMRFVLEGSGHPVVTAANGAEALDRLRQGTVPCLILLDLMMPIMNGWEFCAEQKRSAEFSAIPVIILTGAGRAAEEAAALGVTGYLEKPVELATLLATIRRYC
jgi:CheY-like chemotaxis protein